jgi:hypothetical protein
MIGPVNNQDEHDHTDDEPSLRQANRLRVRGWTDRRLNLVAAGDFAFEPLDTLERIEAQIVGIAADEAHGIGPARQRLEAIFLERFEMIASDFQCARDRREIVTTPKAGSPQILADSFKGGVRIAGNLAEMNPLPTESAAFVEC